MFKDLATFFRAVSAILLLCISNSALATSCSFSWSSCGFNPNYTSYPVAMQTLGGSNTFATPQIEVNTSFTFGLPFACCSDSNTAVLGINQSASMPVYIATINITATESSSSNNNICCPPPSKMGSNNMGQNGGVCSVPDFNSYFGQPSAPTPVQPTVQNCNGCNNSTCTDAYSGNPSQNGGWGLMGSYTCAAITQYSMMCNMGIDIPALCASGEVQFVGQPITTINYGCFPFPPAPPPPPLCACGVPGIPPITYAYPLCTNFLPAMLTGSGTVPYGAVNNNCSPSFAPTPNISTYFKPYASVTTNNLSPIQNWSSSSGPFNYIYCPPSGSTSILPPAGQISVPLCASSGCSSSNQNCVYLSGSSNSKVAPGYVSNGNVVSTIFPIVYLTPSSAVSSPNGTNIAFTNNVYGGATSQLFGINVNQVLEIPFNFAANGFSNSSNCMIGNAGDTGACPGTTSASFTDNQGNTRTFGTFLPAACGPCNGRSCQNNSATPTTCPQFCVAEILEGGSANYLLGCFNRPTPQSVTVAPCIAGPGILNNCSDSDIPSSYNSITNWCLEITVTDSGISNTGRLCSNNYTNPANQKTGEIYYPITLCTNANPNQPSAISGITVLLTDFNFNQPNTIPYISNGEQLGIINSFCSTPVSGNNAYTNSTSCGTGLFYYSNTDTMSRTSAAQTIIRESTMICPMNYPQQPACVPVCNYAQCAAGCSPNECPECVQGCNCIASTQNYCPVEQEVLNSTLTSQTTCPTSGESFLASPRNIDRVSVDSSPGAPNNTNDTLFGMLAPNQFYNNYTNSYTPSSNSSYALRGRNPIEQGLCLPMASRDPVDCCALFGSTSNFNKYYQSLPNPGPGIANLAETFYSSCQVFNCNYCTVGLSDLSANNGTYNDMLYIRSICENIYQNCANSTPQNIALVNTSMLSNSNLQNQYNTYNSTITQLINTWGNNALCSFFQQPYIPQIQPRFPEIAISDLCSSSSATINPTSGTQTYCGCIAPGQLQPGTNKFVSPPAPISGTNVPFCYLTPQTSEINISTNGFCNTGFSSCSIASTN